MDMLWGAESDGVRWVQGWGTWLEPLMQVVTFLGAQTFFIVLLAVVFWSVDAKTGARIGVLLLASSTINGVFKAVLYAPRPYWYDPGIRLLAEESTFGAPSGHAQTSITVWGYLAVLAKRRDVRIAAVVLIALICLSRVYLGAHFFSDIALGLLLGGVLIWAAHRYEARVLARWRSLSVAVQAVGAVAASAVPVALVAGYQELFRSDWTVPEEWTGSIPADVAAEALVHTGGAAGGLLGTVIGLTVLDRRGWYSAAGSLVTRAARFVTGITGVVLILVVLRVAVPGGGGAIAEYAGFLLVALWVTLAAPELFVRMRMADRGSGGDRECGGVADCSCNT